MYPTFLKKSNSLEIKKKICSSAHGTIEPVLFVTPLCLNDIRVYIQGFIFKMIGNTLFFEFIPN